MLISRSVSRYTRSHGSGFKIKASLSLGADVAQFPTFALAAGVFRNESSCVLVFVEWAEVMGRQVGGTQSHHRLVIHECDSSDVISMQHLLPPTLSPGITLCFKVSIHNLWPPLYGWGSAGVSICCIYLGPPANKHSEMKCTPSSDFISFVSRSSPVQRYQTARSLFEYIWNAGAALGGV